MKILFTNSESGEKKLKSQFEHVRNAIGDHKDVELTTPRDSKYNQLVREYLKGTNRKLTTVKYFDAMNKLIRDSDAVIIDNSHESFKLGFEAATALMNNKPLLVLSSRRDFSGYIRHKHFYAAKYRRLVLPEIIERFLRRVRKKQLNVRFNMMLSQEQTNKVSRNAEFDNVSNSEYIRRLIDEDVDR